MYNYNLKFTTITPLHISNGEFLDQNFHYTIFNDKLFKIDSRKLSVILAKEEKINFQEEITTKKIESWIIKHQLKIIDNAVSYSINIDESFKRHLNNQKADGQRQVLEFINFNGSFYIPASSIKGALLTALGMEMLGIDPNNANMKDKFILADTSIISPDEFIVYQTNNRPPKTNLICLQPQRSFVLVVKKQERLPISQIKSNLMQYSSNQIELAKKYLQKFRGTIAGKRQNGADLFFDGLRNISEYKTSKNEYLINIGFGGGSYFKIKSGIKPHKFINERKDKISKRKIITEEEAHTSVSFNFRGETNHIGWCKLEIEEL